MFNEFNMLAPQMLNSFQLINIRCECVCECVSNPIRTEGTISYFY